MYCEKCGAPMGADQRCTRCGGVNGTPAAARPCTRSPLAPQVPVPRMYSAQSAAANKPPVSVLPLSVIAFAFAVVGVAALSLAFALYTFYDLTGEGWIVWFYVFAFFPAAVMAVIALIECKRRNRGGGMFAVVALLLSACAPIVAGVGQAFFLLLLSIMENFGGFLPRY